MMPSAPCPSLPGVETQHSPSARLSRPTTSALTWGRTWNVSLPLRSLAPDLLFLLLRTLFSQFSPSHPSGSALTSFKQPSQTSPNWLRHPTSAEEYVQVFLPSARPGVGQNSRSLCSPTGPLRPRHRKCLWSHLSWFLVGHEGDTTRLVFTRNPQSTALTRCSANRLLKTSRGWEQSKGQGRAGAQVSQHPAKPRALGLHQRLAMVPTAKQLPRGLQR